MMAKEGKSIRPYRFGGFTLDPNRGALLRGGEEIGLRPKSYAVLHYLVKHHGRLVTKRELLDAIWGHSYVSDGSLTQCLIDVRRALGDESREVVRTVPRRGYIFELAVTRPDGGQPDNDGRESTPAGSPARPTRANTGLALSVLSLVLLGAAVWWSAGYLGIEVPILDGSGSPAPRNSIAVLPFADMSPGRDHEYFADGLSEELINVLAQIPGLKVTARTSSFAFKDASPDISTVVRKLNVAHVLEGSVRKSGNILRITAQLVDAETNTHLWSKTFDRELSDIFAVQSEIAESVAEAMKVTLAEREADIIAATHDPQAYDHFLQGQFFWNRRGPDDVGRAELHYKRSVEIDPDLARAWVGLAGVYRLQMVTGGLPEPEALEKQRLALERALEIAPDMAEAHARAANYFWLVGNRAKAEKHWTEARALGPDNVLVLAMAAGEALWRGLYEEAVELQQQAVALDPLVATNRGNLASMLLAAGRPKDAEAELLKAMALSPGLGSDSDDPFRDTTSILIVIKILLHRFDEALALIERQPPGPARDQSLTLVNTGLGRYSEAEAVLERMRRRTGIDDHIRLAEVYAYRGDTDEAFRWLTPALGRVDPARRSPDWQYARVIWKSPLLRPLRDDPRWGAMWADWRR